MFVMSENEFKKEPMPSVEVDSPLPPSPRKEPRRVSLTTFITSAVALVLVAVMLTYTVCSGYLAECANNQFSCHNHANANCNRNINPIRTTSKFAKNIFFRCKQKHKRRCHENFIRNRIKEFP